MSRELLVMVATLGALLGACGDETTSCERDDDCDDTQACTVDTCEAGSCVHTPLPDGTPTPGYNAEPPNCRTTRCLGGSPEEVDDEEDVEEDEDPDDCRVPSCAAELWVATLPSGSPCEYDWDTTGVCNADGSCEPPPNPVCDAYCAVCPDNDECVGCDEAQCVLRCNTYLTSPCSDERLARYDCAAAAGDCALDACAVERQAVDDCSSECGVTCNGCGCRQACDGHEWQTSCNWESNVNTCTCIYDGDVVETCTSDSAGCLATDLCCDFW